MLPWCTERALGAEGAFTGEVSVPMLEDYCRYVIIGHSERRQFFGETDETVRKRLAAVLLQGSSRSSVWEKPHQRRSGETEDVLSRQLREALAGLTIDERVTIAYEPVWAIGTGETATRTSRRKPAHSSAPN
jgi:triosephosphate isomerase